MSSEIPDIKNFENKKDTHSDYSDLKQEIINELNQFKDSSKNMVAVKLKDIPEKKLIQELEEKNYIVKYEIYYDKSSGINGNLRIYRPGYVSDSINEIFDIIKITVPTDQKDKMENIFNKFKQFSL